MKAAFFRISILFLCITLNVQVFGQKEPVRIKTIFTESAESDNQFFLSEYIGMFSHAANKENGQHLILRLYPISQKYFFGSISLNEAIWSFFISEIINYLIFNDFLIIRFDRPAIIYPFHYFW